VNNFTHARRGVLDESAIGVDHHPAFSVRVLERSNAFFPIKPPNQKFKPEQAESNPDLWGA
jgi:hypothetical protein